MPVLPPLPQAFFVPKLHELIMEIGMHKTVSLPNTKGFMLVSEIGFGKVGDVGIAHIKGIFDYVHLL